jgi:beta-lactamase regulating signal transducer with metallopeptidase domain
MTALEMSRGFVTEAGSAWLAVLADATLKGAVVLILAIVATRRMRHASAATRHLVWLLAIVALLLLPILRSVLPGWEGIPAGTFPSFPTTERAVTGRTTPAHGHERSTKESSGDLPTARQRAEALADSVEIEVATGIASADFSSGTQVSTAAPYTWQVLVTLAWLLGAAISMAPWALGIVSLHRARRSVSLIADGPLVDALGRAAEKMGVRREVILLSSRTRRVPMQWGILRPKLLIPAEALDWPADRLRVVLLHELAHIRRADCAALLAAHLALAIYWFNPLVWLARRRMQIEAEAACDNMVLRAGCIPADYARHLVEIASDLPPGGLAGYVAIAISRSARLEGRVRAILDRRCDRRPPAWGTIVAALASLFALLVPLAMLRAAGKAEPAATLLAGAPDADQKARSLKPDPARVENRADDAPKAKQHVARQEQEVQHVREAVARGVGFLKRQQKPDGSWVEYSSQKGGVTALCALALARSGVADNERSVRKAAEYLQLQETDRTYSVALQTMFLSAADPKAHAKTIRRNVQWMEQAQRNGGWSYDIRGGEVDHSNTHFALMALDATDTAGVTAQPKTWRTSLEHWIKAQNPDGSWGYKVGSQGTGSMTCAGMSSVAMGAARIGKQEDLAKQAIAAIEKANQWMSRNSAVDRNPGSPIKIWVFYYLHALTRAGQDAERPKIGGHDWYQELSAFLTIAQRAADGAWSGKGPIETEPLIATSFAILSLAAEPRAEAMPRRRRP